MPPQNVAHLDSQCKGGLESHSGVQEEFQKHPCLLDSLAMCVANEEAQQEGHVPHPRSQDTHCCNLNRVTLGLRIQLLLPDPAQGLYV